MSEPMTIEQNDISTAWAKSLLRLHKRGVKEISPLVVTVKMDSFAVPEAQDIRNELDECIAALKTSGVNKLTKLQPVHTVANTIFPCSFWNQDAENDAELLYSRFERAWPRIKRCAQNRRGSYFRRLTAFRSDGDKAPINQLAHIVETYQRGNHRRSALQASVFDPTLDHKHNRVLGFPCLHQVAFAPVDNEGLSVTGFYATQYAFDRAYGNYLGLCHLGNFVAAQLGLTLVRMTCVAATALLGTPNKEHLAELVNRLGPLVHAGEGSDQ